MLAAATALAACAHTAIENARQDAVLMEEIARANIAGIAAGNLAVTRTPSPELRRFAVQLVDERSALLKAGSGAAGVAVPSTPGAKHEAPLKSLRSLSGEAFDQAFLDYMVKHNAETLRLLQEAAAHAADGEVRALAQRAIPLVERHLELAASFRRQ